MEPSSGRVLFDIVLEGQIEFELGWQLLIRVLAVGKVDPSQPAIRIHSYTRCLHVVGSIGAPCEVGKIQIDVIPAGLQFQWHGADEILDSSFRLVVRGSEAPFGLCIVQYLNFECEKSIQILDNQNDVIQLDAEALVDLWTGYVGRGDV